MVLSLGRTRPASLLARTAALTLAAGVLVGGLLVGAATPAGATTNPSLALDPAGTVYGVGPAEHAGETSASAGPVDVRWGGRLTVTLPPGLVDDGSLLVSVGLAGRSPGSPPVLYSSAAGASRHLRVTASAGSQALRVDLPANDGVHGPTGWLTMVHFGVRGGVDVHEGSDPSYALRFSAAAPHAVALSPQLLLSDSLAADGAASLSVVAGSAFDVTLPADARLSRLGIPGLRTAAFSLHGQDTAGDSTGTAIVLGPVLSQDGRTASLAVPPGTAAGSYRLEVVVSNGAGTVRADVQELLAVRGPMASPSLRNADSSTPAPGSAEGAPVLPLGWILPLALGAALLLVAAVGGAAGLLWSRPRSVGERS